jgi:hypothetical protein
MAHRSMMHRRTHGLLVVAMAAALLLGTLPAPPAHAAASVFVNPAGSDTDCNGAVDAPATSAPDCAFASVRKGVAQANAGDTVIVATGIYTENITIDKPLTLRGAQAQVDARTRLAAPATESILANGVYVNADGVAIDGFTVQDADFKGDLGTGIYLASVHSGYQILNNIIQNNIFGLYLNSSGATQAIVRGNLFKNNNRPGNASGDAIYSDLGLASALIDNNMFVGNNRAAVELFGTDPPAQSNITISNNRIEGGDRPLMLWNMAGSAITSNLIVNASSPAGAAIGIYGGVGGLSIVGNTILSGAGAAVRIMNTLGGNSNISAHFNRMVGNAAGGIAILPNGYNGTLDAENNWWGCNAGPGNPGCDTASASVHFSPWLTLGISAAPGSIFVNGTATLTASLTVNSDGIDTSALGHILDGTPIAFASTLGDVAQSSVGMLAGEAQTLFAAGAVTGTAIVSASLDSTIATTISIDPKRDTTTDIRSSANPAAVGQTVTFTATVNAAAPGQQVPSGTVTFKDGAVKLGTGLLNAAGLATFSTARLGVGQHTITASYGGDGAFNPSDGNLAALSQTIAKAETVTTITDDTPDPSAIGQVVTVHFSVTAQAPGGGTPTGTATVQSGDDTCTGSVLIGGSGSCSLNLTGMGVKILTVTYAGDSNYNGSFDSATHSVVIHSFFPIALS